MFGPANTTPRMTCAEYKARFFGGKEAHTLLDVRTSEEFVSGYIPGAINIAVQDLGRRLDEVPQDKPVVIYCRSGNRSAMAAGLLQQRGYAEVYDLGGIIGWASNGYPLKKGK
jgi:rhodanese-related sulfurtransferase